jgi:hypothetical protein
LEVAAGDLDVARLKHPGEPLAKRKGNRMTLITVKLTEQELGLLTVLASDQLFRREFIDPKMPGYKFNPAELNMGKKLVERLRLLADRARKVPSSRMTHAV